MLPLTTPATTKTKQPYWPRGKPKRPERVCRDLRTHLRARGFPRVPTAQLLKCLVTRSNLLRSRPDAFAEKLARASALLGIAKPELLTAALSNPSLFSIRPETLVAYAHANAELLGMSAEQFRGLALRGPWLFSQTPRNLSKRLHGMQKALSLSAEQVLSLARRQPRFLLSNPETLRQRLGNSALLALDEPNVALTLYSPERLRKNLKASAQALGLSEESVKHLYRRAPAITSRNPHKLGQDARKMGEGLRLTLPELMQLALRQPQLLTQRPRTVIQKFKLIEKLAARNGQAVSAHDIIRQLPAALCYSTDRIKLCTRLVARTPGRASIAYLLTYKRQRIEGMLAQLK